MTEQAACAETWTMSGTCDPNPCPCPLPGDVNADGVVDGLDVQGFVDCLLAGGPNCRCSDFNGDTLFDLNDLSGFLAALGVAPTP